MEAALRQSHHCIQFCEPRIFDTIKSYKDALKHQAAAKVWFTAIQVVRITARRATGKPRTIIMPM